MIIDMTVKMVTMINPAHCIARVGDVDGGFFDIESPRN